MIQLHNVSPIRGNPLVDPVNATVSPGNIVVFMGPSGIGKSSLLETLAGKLPHTGTVKIHREIFRVYQDSEQLFPWMTVLDNLNLANSSMDWYTLADEWQLANLLHKQPTECSTGQRQRLTLLRALHSGRDILLCDEPLSGVDYNTAYTICNSFKKLVKKYKKTVVWVTHNPAEAELLGKVISLQ